MALEEDNSDTDNEEKVNEKIESVTKPSFNEMMEERKTVNKWFVMGIFLAGVFCGTCLGVIFMWLAFVV